MSKNKETTKDVLSDKEVDSLVEQLKYYQTKVDLLWIKLNHYTKRNK